MLICCCAQYVVVLLGTKCVDISGIHTSIEFKKRFFRLLSLWRYCLFISVTLPLNNAEAIDAIPLPPAICGIHIKIINVLNMVSRNSGITEKLVNLHLIWNRFSGIVYFFLYLNFSFRVNRRQIWVFLDRIRK